jgi:hypothetical protein
LDATFSHCSPNKQGNKEGKASAAAANLKVKGGELTLLPQIKVRRIKDRRKTPCYVTQIKSFFFNIQLLKSVLGKAPLGLSTYWCVVKTDNEREHVKKVKRR